MREPARQRGILDEHKVIRRNAREAVDDYRRMDTPTERARALRRRQTYTEHLFWQRVRNRRLFGYKFRRQVWFGRYVADFVCLELRLIVELDGGHHASQILKDKARDEEFTRLGFRVIRYWDNEVLRNLDGVLTDLAQRIDQRRTNPSVA